jgi:hypothetical protein
VSAYTNALSERVVLQKEVAEKINMYQRMFRLKETKYVSFSVFHGVTVLALLILIICLL